MIHPEHYNMTLTDLLDLVEENEQRMGAPALLVEVPGRGTYYVERLPPEDPAQSQEIH